MNFSVNQNSKSTKSYQIDSFHHFISHFVVGCLAPSGARFRGGSGTPQHLGGGTTGWKTTTWDWWISWWWIYESMNLKDFFNKKHICSSIISCFFKKNPVTLLDSWKSNTQVFFLMEETPRQASGCGQDHGMVPSIEAEAVHHLWTCDRLTCQGLWENVRSKHGNEMQRKWRQHLDLMEKILSDLGGVFLVFHIVFGWCWRNSLKMMPFIYTWNFFFAIPILRERFASPRIFFLVLSY